MGQGRVSQETWVVGVGVWGGRRGLRWEMGFGVGDGV